MAAKGNIFFISVWFMQCPGATLFGKMAVTVKQTSLVVATLGVISFVLGIITENKKPASGYPVLKDGVVKCKYPNDPTVALGYLSVVFLVVSTVIGYLSQFYPYKGQSVPQGMYFRNMLKNPKPQTLFSLQLYLGLK